MNTFVSNVKESQDLVQQGRVKSALEVNQRGLSVSQSWLEQAVVHFNRGAIFWSVVGNGDEARNCFQQTIKKWERNGKLSDKMNDPVLSGSYENMMCLSLSFEEYFMWGQRLQSIAPNEDIVCFEIPEIKKDQKAGLSWFQVKMHLLNGYVHENPKQNPGLYGCAASILQLLLKYRKNGFSFLQLFARNKKALKMTRENWRIASIVYPSVVRLAARKCSQTIWDRLGYDNQDQWMFMIDSAIPLAEEYLKVYPDDEVVQKSFVSLTSMKFEWQISPELNSAIHNTVLEQTKFKLLESKLNCDWVELRFQPLSEISKDIVNSALLALNCTVGLTLSNLISNLTTYHVHTEPGWECEIKLLNHSVTFPIFFVETKRDKIGPLIVDREEQDENLRLYIRPYDLMTFQNPKVQKAFSDIAEAFKALEGTIISFTP